MDNNNETKELCAFVSKKHNVKTIFDYLPALTDEIWSYIDTLFTIPDEKFLKEMLADEFEKICIEKNDRQEYMATYKKNKPKDIYRYTVDFITNKCEIPINIPYYKENIWSAFKKILLCEDNISWSHSKQVRYICSVIQSRGLEFSWLKNFMNVKYICFMVEQVNKCLIKNISSFHASHRSNYDFYGLLPYQISLSNERFVSNNELYCLTLIFLQNDKRYVHDCSFHKSNICEIIIPSQTTLLNDIKYVRENVLKHCKVMVKDDYKKELYNRERATDNMIRFITNIISSRIDVESKPPEELFELLASRQHREFDSINGSYDYLKLDPDFINYFKLDPNPVDSKTLIILNGMLKETKRLRKLELITDSHMDLDLNSEELNDTIIELEILGS